MFAAAAAASPARWREGEREELRLAVLRPLGRPSILDVVLAVLICAHSSAAALDVRWSRAVLSLSRSLFSCVPFSSLFLDLSCPGSLSPLTPAPSYSYAPTTSSSCLNYTGCWHVHTHTHARKQASRSERFARSSYCEARARHTYSYVLHASAISFFAFSISHSVAAVATAAPAGAAALRGLYRNWRRWFAEITVIFA